jgi:hypothetical protein
MNDSPETGSSFLKDVPPGVWLALPAMILAIAVALHGIFPRYEMAAVGAEGRSVVVFDRWTGQFQRADFGAQGEVTVTSVVKPF